MPARATPKRVTPRCADNVCEPRGRRQAQWPPGRLRAVPCAVLGFGWVLAAAGLLASARADEERLPPAPRSARSIWENKRLRGSPDPPPPYAVEPVLTQIEWKAPLYAVSMPGKDELLVVLQGGEDDRPSRVVRCVNRPDSQRVETFLEVPGRLVYALAFHPDFAANGQVFVFSNGPTGAAERANRVSRWTVRPGGPAVCDPASEQTILEWRSMGHDGGDLAFGHDRMLYIASGDGTSDSDTWDSGQDLSNLLGAVLRIDVDRPDGGRSYRVPPDNPFVDRNGARGEIWAYGLRNPWRMCVDAKSGELWVGNNGQDLWETAHLVGRGDNFGWSVYEGSHPFYLNRRRGPTPIVPPTIEHPHSEFRSLTGGVVYYGPRLPELEGAYIYGDYSTGKIWGAKQRAGKLAWRRELADTTLQIAAFTVDRQGELLVVDHGGGLYRLVANRDAWDPAEFPRLLSETGLLESAVEHRPAPGLIRYTVNAPGWADGAFAERFLALPRDASITFTGAGGWNFGNGAVVMQTLSLAAEPQGRAVPRRIETRLLVRRQGEWAGYSYLWRDDQTDAELVSSSGQDVALDSSGGETSPEPMVWRIPSRADCLVCHSRAANYVLGLTAQQMNRAAESGATSDGENQLDLLTREGLFQAPGLPSSGDAGRLVDPYDAAAPLEDRARSYLAANCAMCHVEAGGGNAQLQLDYPTPRAKMNLIGARPQHDTFSLTDAMLVAPGRPDQSVLVHRLAVRGRGQMPPLGVTRVDKRAVALFREWIGELRPERPFVRAWSTGELLPALDQLAQPRSPETGGRLFRELGCAQCHRFAGAGGTVGPELSDAGRRLGAAGLLESILEPSRTIPEAYAQIALQTADGRLLVGRIEREDDQAVILRTGPLLSEVVALARDEVIGREPSRVSNMPAGMVDVLSQDELLDLLAYLLTEPAPPPAAE